MRKKGRPEIPEAIRQFEGETRKLKVIITIIVYGILLLLIKIFYDTIVDISQVSIGTVFLVIAYALGIFILFINKFSKNVIRRINGYVQSLQEARKYAESIVDTVPDPLVILDQDCKILSANSSFHRVFNLSPGNYAQKKLFELNPPQWEIPKLETLLADLDDPKINFDNLEIEQTVPQHRKRSLLVSSRCVSREGQKVILLSIKDITDQRKAQEELRQKSLQLQIASNAKSDFLANMSHELRTPLNAIIGFSEVLKDEITGERLTYKQREYIGEIFKNGHHLLSLINDILDLSKIEAGKMDLNLENIYIPMLLQNCLIIVKERAANHCIQLDLNMEDGLDSAFIDSRKFKQIVFNLLSNAIKFTPDGGSVTIKARRMFMPDPRTRAAEGEQQTADRAQAREYIEISVTDTGIGISSKDIPRLFQPFEQVDSSLSRKYKGTGLGLPMVQRLVELHGGVVSVRSDLGKGSTFIIRLPYRREPSSV